MRRAAALLLVLALLASVVGLHRSLWAMHQDEQFPFRSFFLPDSEHMKVLSLGYRNFWADLTYIWSILYYDYYRREDRYVYLTRTFEVITDLDPRNREAYVMCALFAFMGGRFDLVYRFLDKGIVALPQDSILPYEAGTYALFMEKNSARAARYFELAAKRNPEQTVFKKYLATALASEGDTGAARMYWREIYEAYKDSTTPEAGYYRGTALRNLWNLKVQADVQSLGTAIQSYQARFGSLPPTLHALVRAGLLRTLPLDPRGVPYAYEPATGGVSCVSEFDYKTAYGGW